MEKRQRKIILRGEGCETRVKEGVNRRGVLKYLRCGVFLVLELVLKLVFKTLISASGVKIVKLCFTWPVKLPGCRVLAVSE